MCGFTGFIDQDEIIQNPLADLERMNDSLSHRGPDSSGTWHHPGKRVFIGHRRLAVIDVTDSGAQPMISGKGRYVLAFNGEIYNFHDLSWELARSGIRFNGGSDTEVLACAFDHWGIEETLDRCCGMFSLAAWDREESTLVLARDRLGEKPLYYGFSNGVFLFGSELKALAHCSAWTGEIDKSSLGQFFKYSYIPTPNSIYRGIRKLPPGHLLTIGFDRARHAEPEPVAYWNPGDYLRDEREPSSFKTPRTAINSLDKLLNTSIQRQMIADVPVGAFLSGGIDSSLIVAIMQAQSECRVQTFSIGFHDSHYDESDSARAVAGFIGTDHMDLMVTPAEARDVVPALPAMFDEPFSDSSQIPTYLVARLTRSRVTVSLSGDGGDELFGGYNRHYHAPNIWRRINRVPERPRCVAAEMIQAIPPNLVNVAYRLMNPLVPANRKPRILFEKVNKFGRILGASSYRDMYDRLVSTNPDAHEILADGVPGDVISLPFTDGGTLSLGRDDGIMFADLNTYLPDDILVKLDRASMAVSLESRAPFLDRDVVEFALGLPVEFKIRENTGKWILREVLDRYVPRRLVDRPKMGFGIPIGNWIRTELRDWAEDLLDPAKIEAQGLLQPEAVNILWQEHLTGKRNWDHRLWSILSFQMWYSEWVEKKPSTGQENHEAGQLRVAMGEG